MLPGAACPFNGRPPWAFPAVPNASYARFWNRLGHNEPERRRSDQKFSLSWPVRTEAHEAAPLPSAQLDFARKSISTITNFRWSTE